MIIQIIDVVYKIVSIIFMIYLMDNFFRVFVPLSHLAATFSSFIHTNTTKVNLKAEVTNVYDVSKMTLRQEDRDRIMEFETKE